MKKIAFTFGLFVLALLPLAFTLAQGSGGTSGGGAPGGGFTFIVDFPRPAGSGVGTGSEITAEDFVNILYALAISIAGLLAVIKIIYAGVKYMLTDIAPGKEQAKKDIWGAILGLVIVLAAVFILETVNPQLSTLRIFRDTQSVNAPGSGSGSAVTTPNGPATGANNANQLPANAVSDTFAIQCQGAGMVPVRTCQTSSAAGAGVPVEVCAWDCKSGGGAAPATSGTGSSTGTTN